MTNRIVVTTQAELDALPDKFGAYTVIEIRSPETAWITVNKARESSHVVARESSHVEAWGSSHVVAWGSVGVHIHSESVRAFLYGFAVAWIVAKKAKAVCKQKTARIVRPKRKPGAIGWLADNALSPKGGKVVLYKRVSKDWKTQEGTPRETEWRPGSKLIHPAWDPKVSECGSGKFHACSTAYFCDEFRSAAGDRYVAIEINVRDLYAWPNGDYPHKIAFRAGRVLHEVDRYGELVEAKS